MRFGLRRARANATEADADKPLANDGGTQTTPTRRTFITGTLLGAAAGVAGTTGLHTVVHLSDESSEHQSGHHSEVDIGFCTDMTVHHIQAIGMCERVLGQPTGGPVQAAATEVIRNQSIEVGMMRAWLTDWGASTVDPTYVMAWMADHSEMDDHNADTDNGIPLADMPGYATEAELSALVTAEGVEKGRMWLELMRTHHVGGVAMAEAAAQLATTEKVVRLATMQVSVQSWEIEQYDILLASDYA